ncbi:MAG: leucine zipper domain-containing protein [Polyangiales bacterium]
MSAPAGRRCHSVQTTDEHETFHRARTPSLTAAEGGGWHSRWQRRVTRGESTQVQARAWFIEEWIADEYESLAASCAAHGVSRETGHKSLARFKGGGKAGLADSQSGGGHTDSDQCHDGRNDRRRAGDGGGRSTPRSAVYTTQRCAETRANAPREAA